MSNKKKQHSSENSISNRTIALFRSKKTTLTTRQVLATLNKGKRKAAQVTIHGVRNAVRKLIEGKRLIVSQTKRKAFVLHRNNK